MSKIKKMIVEERPRERLMNKGENSLATKELLAIIICSGSKQKSALAVAELVLNRAKTLRGLMQMTLSELMEIEGIGIAKAIAIKAAIELGLRVEQEETKKISFTNPEQVYQFLKKDMINLEQEIFVCLYLDVKCCLKAKKTISIGSLNHTSVSAREVFRWAVKESAYGIIIAHNHPSGDPRPSVSDETLTNQFVRIGKEMDIQICDHIIIGHNNFYSFLAEKNSNLV